MFYPVELDKVRNLRYGMKAISLIEKKFKCPVMKIEGITTGELTMENYATIIWAGLAHEDKNLTPDKVMDLIDEHSSLKKVSKVMWEAFNDSFADDEEKQEEVEGEEEKNE